MIKKIKDGETFYSGSFNFTKKDFDEVEDNDDFMDDTSGNVVKIIFLILGLIVIAAAIYFILTKYVL